jgi:hypothetical protein
VGIDPAPPLRREFVLSTGITIVGGVERLENEGRGFASLLLLVI